MITYHDSATGAECVYVCSMVSRGGAIAFFHSDGDDCEPIVTLDRDSVAALIGQLQSWLDRRREAE